MTPAEAAAYATKAVAAPASPAWGTASTSLLTLGPCDAGPQDFDEPFNANAGGTCGRLQPAEFPSEARAGLPIHLPAGALIEEITVNYYDSHPLEDPSIGLWEIVPLGGGRTLRAALTPDPFSLGSNSQTFVLDPPHEFDTENMLVVLAILNNGIGDEIIGIDSIAIRYRLQVSPAPANATFGDVPTSHPFFRYVEALADSGITAGCGGGDYCVDTPLTRGQMAVFLSLALGLHFPN